MINMEKCLVTKLKGVVDANLLKIGELQIAVSKIDSPTSTTQALLLNVSKDITLSIIGDGYFTDSSITSNLGKSLNIPANTNTSVYHSNGDFIISVSDKYSLITLSYPTISDSIINKTMEIESLRYSDKLTSLRFYSGLTGDFCSLSRLKNITDIYINNNKELKGDISGMSFDNLTGFSCSNSGLSGSTNGFANNTVLSYLNTQKTNIIINPADLAKTTKLGSILGVFTGNLDYLKNNPILSTIQVDNDSNCTGDLAILPQDMTKFVSPRTISYTWSSRPNSSKKFSINGNPIISNIDKMLQDLAACADNPSVTGKVISATGTRTSASDTAISTLQTAGWTVYIAPIV